MVDSRVLTAGVGLLASVAVSLFAYWQFDTLLVFLVLPFLPILFRRGGDAEAEERVRECPECGFRTTDPEFTHCPRDGRELDGGR